ncbi:hypothetical protein [Kribbella antiqua]|uniref:hypothetical protein n=1 Tax=Kribbella antiqua TaxID=2512217 RepID=UPI001F53FC2A|nr:hypothetical protein [Kribbella antiqua]
MFEQSWAPHDMRGGGSVNADGFGLGWYVDATPTVPAGVPGSSSTPAAPAAAPVSSIGPASTSIPSTTPTPAAGHVSPTTPAPAPRAARQPVRYRRSVPIWADENLPALVGSISSGAVIAAVRNGTVGMPLGESAVAPFQRDRWFFSHNGVVRGWPSSVAKLAERLPAASLLTLDASLDSALLWALIADRLYDGSTPADAVASVIQEVEAAAPGSRLNVLLTDGEQLVATTWTHSLWFRQTADSITVSSEPFSADGWTEVPDYSLLVATNTTLHITPMEGPQ